MTRGSDSFVGRAVLPGGIVRGVSLLGGTVRGCRLLGAADPQLQPHWATDLGATSVDLGAISVDLGASSVDLVDLAVPEIAVRPHRPQRLSLGLEARLKHVLPLHTLPLHTLHLDTLPLGLVRAAPSRQRGDAAGR